MIKWEKSRQGRCYGFRPASVFQAVSHFFEAKRTHKYAWDLRKFLFEEGGDWHSILVKSESFATLKDAKSAAETWL